MVNPLLIQFCHPQLWVEAVTSYNNNGEVSVRDSFNAKVGVRVRVTSVILSRGSMQ
jgi:hypothetical protein